MNFDVGRNVFSNQKTDVKKQPTPQPSPTVATIIAKAVSASKLENDDIISVGKYGFALAGDTKQNYYQLLLYGSKSSVLVNLKLTKDFKYNVNENNIVEFKANENWRLEFTNSNDAIDFNSHMAFVLWKLNGSKELFWIDLYFPPRNDGVSTFGSVVEIVYVANTIQGKKIGPEVSSNVNDDRYLKVNVSEEGWERSLLGVNDNTQRIVYIPVAKMGAWKILTDGRQCLCLTVTVKKVYAIEENATIELPPSVEYKPLDNDSNQSSSSTHSKDTVDDGLAIEVVIASTKTVSIETLSEEFEKLKNDSIITNKRLTQLEELFKGKTSEKIKNLSDTELRKLMKFLYKSIVQEFPADQTFSGNQIHTKIKDIISNVLMCSNQTPSHSE